MPVNGNFSYAFYDVPYRDTEGRELVRDAAISQLLKVYNANSNLNQPPAVRPIDPYDFTSAGATNVFKNNTANIQFTALATPEDGYGYGTSISFTVPTTNVFIIYGISDVSSSINLRAMKVTVSGKDYVRYAFYPELLKSQDQMVIFASPFRPFPPNTKITITLYSFAAGTDEIWFKGFVGEQGGEPNTQ